MSLRARLFLALLALALLPTAVLTLFTLDQLDRSTRRWFLPGVERALESSHEVTKTALARLDATVLSYAPGGFAEMSLIGLALGIEVAMVATHHLFRLFLILLTSPLIFRFWRPYS